MYPYILPKLGELWPTNGSELRLQSDPLWWLSWSLPACSYWYHWTKVKQTLPHVWKWSGLVHACPGFWNSCSLKCGAQWPITYFWVTL